MFYLDRPIGGGKVNRWFIHCKICGRHWGGAERIESIIYSCCKKMPRELIDKRDFLNNILKY